MANSFAAMVELNQSITINTRNVLDAGTGSDHKDFGVVAGIEFNKDGTKMFTSFANQACVQTNKETGESEQGEVCNSTTYNVSFRAPVINTYNLSTPYDISTQSFAGDSERCEMTDLDAGGNGTFRTVYDLELSSDGMKLLVVTRNLGNDADDDKAYVYDLSSPYDISSCSQSSTTTNLDSSTFTDGSKAGTTTGLRGNHRLQGIEINDNGTKLFLIFFDETDDNTRLYEYNLTTPYDLTTLSLNTNAGIELTFAENIDNAAGMRFSPNGKRLFVVTHDLLNERALIQISLSNPFDTSSFVIDGALAFSTFPTTHDQPRGIAFNSSGLKMYITDDRQNSGIDEIKEYDLKCPFNIFEGKCPSITENNERHGLAIAQIEIAKRTIDHSTDTALNRLKWIRRNKDKQNLSNLNIDINFTNERLASLTELVKTTAAKKKTNSDKDQDVFYWSEGSISVGKIGDSSISSSRKIDTNAITFGSDRFTKNNGIRGLAFRFGKNNVDVGNAGSNLDTDTYNITYYDTSPIKDDTKFLDKIFGIGKLSSDLLTVLDGKKLTAKRNGRQMYGTFRIKDEIKKDNLIMIPYGRLDVGHTILGSYVESGQGAIEAEKQHVRTKKIRAGLSAIEDLSNDKYTFKRHGKLEYVADIDRSSNFKYTYVGDRSATLNDTLHSEAIHNINGEIGIDIVLPDSFSIFLIYERNQAIDAGHTDKIHIAIGYLPNKDTNYAFSIEGSENLLSKLELKKNINGFNLSFNVKDNLTNTGDNREANIALNKVF